MTSRFFSVAVPSAIAESARSYPLCILTAFLVTAGFLWPDEGITYLRSQLIVTTVLPTAFGALAGALAFQNASSGKRLLAHGIGFALGLAGGILSLIGEDPATVLSIALLAYLDAALCAGRAAGGGRSGFWRANVLGLTSLFVGIIVVAIGLVAAAVILLAVDVLLDIGAMRAALGGVFVVGLALLCPIIALTGLRPSVLADPGRPDAGYLAVLATVTDALLIPLIITLALVIHVYAGTILMKAALPDGGIGWVATTYLVAGYGIPGEKPSVPRRSSNFPWDVLPLASTTLIPLFEVTIPGQESLRSPTGRWTLTARDNRLILDEDGRETIFDLSILLREQPAGMAPMMITIQSDSGRSGTLVLRGFKSIVGESGAPGLLQEIRGSILLQNAPADGAK